MVHKKICRITRHIRRLTTPDGRSPVGPAEGRFQKVELAVTVVAFRFAWGTNISLAGPWVVHKRACSNGVTAGGRWTGAISEAPGSFLLLRDAERVTPVA